GDEDNLTVRDKIDSPKLADKKTTFSVMREVAGVDLDVLEARYVTDSGNILMVFLREPDYHFIRPRRDRSGLNRRISIGRLQPKALVFAIHEHFTLDTPPRG